MSAEHEDGLFTPEGFEDAYATMMYGAAVLAGEDPKADAIASHGFIDADMDKDRAIPAIYNDPAAQALVARNDTDPGVRDEVNALLSRFSLLDLPDEVARMADQFGDPVRAGVVKREAATAKMHMRIFEAIANGQATPSFEERIQVVTGEDPKPVDREKLQELREMAREILGELGYIVTNPKTMDEVVERWEHDLGNADTSDQAAFNERLATYGAEYVQLLRDMVFSQMDTGIVGNEQFQNVPFDRLQYAGRPQMNFDAGLSYIGGQNAGGEPDYKGLFEWNMGRPSPEVDVKYVTGHETVHHIEAVIKDYLRRQGKIGPEARFHTMYSPAAIHSEGLAQVAPELVSGGTLQGVKDKFGRNFALVTVLDRLQDMVRAHVGYEHAVNGTDRFKLREEVIRDFLQNPHIAFKYCGDENKTKPFWREMEQGQMYGKAYELGADAFRASIAKNGVKVTAATGFHLNGRMDYRAFREAMGV